MVKRLPTMPETRVWTLSQEDLLEKEMATHSSILAWEISWTEEPGGLQSMGSQRVGHDWATHYLSISWPKLCLNVLFTGGQFMPLSCPVTWEVIPQFSTGRGMKCLLSDPTTDISKQKHFECLFPTIFWNPFPTGKSLSCLLHHFSMPVPQLLSK